MIAKELVGGRVRVEAASEHITRITFHDPERRNALDLPMLRALDDQLAELAAGATRVLILTGTGKAFCAGFNIGRIEGVPREAQEGENRSDRLPISFCRRLEEFPAATIALLNGHTFGLGGEIAASCDFRIASPGAKYAMPPAKLGLCYHYEGLRKFLALVGPSVAREMFFTGEPLTMERAYEVGLVTHLVAEDARDAKAQELAQAIAGAAPLAVRNMKRSFGALARYPAMPEEIVNELSALERECFASADLLEGRAAFLEKRAPRFRGK